MPTGSPRMSDTAATEFLRIYRPMVQIDGRRIAYVHKAYCSGCVAYATRPDRQSAASAFRRQIQAALMEICFSAFCASGFFGSVSVRIPFLKLASIFSASTPSGTRKQRSNEPKRRSWR